MAHVTYELKMLLTLDDTNEEAMDHIQDMLQGILTGKLQKDLVEDVGLVKVRVTLTEVK